MSYQRFVPQLLIDMRGTHYRLRELLARTQPHAAGDRYALTVLSCDVNEMILHFEQKPMTEALFECARQTIVDANRYIHTLVMRRLRR